MPTSHTFIILLSIVYTMVFLNYQYYTQNQKLRLITEINIFNHVNTCNDCNVLECVTYYYIIIEKKTIQFNCSLLCNTDE